MKNKGMGTPMILVLLFVGVVFAGAIGYLASTALRPTYIAPTAVTYDGEFDDGGVPEDAIGTDLQVETAYADDDDNASMVLNTTSRIDGNMSSQTEYWAYRFEIDDAVEDFEIESEFDPDSDLTATAVDNYDLKAAYIILDDEDLSVTDDDMALYDAVIDADDEEFEFDISVLPEESYVVVLKMKIVDPQDGDLDATFYEITHTLEGEDRDELVVHIENGE